MASPYDQQIEELLAQYREEREHAADTRRGINEVEVTVTAPRRTVKVTVGAQGQVTALDFPTTAYRTLAPKELSKLIVSTIEQARAQALEKVMETVGKLPGGLSPAALAQWDVDLQTLLPEELQLPDVVKEYIERGLGPMEGRGRE
jgi:DNA-binding protein YbaB